MPTANENDAVVTGYPVRRVDFSPTPPIILASPERPLPLPLPCNNHPHEKLRRCIKRSVLVLVVAIIVSFVVTLSVYYIKNQNSAPIIRLESINVSNINHTSYPDNTTTGATANWLLTFKLDNPNRFASIHYKRIQASVFDNDDRRVSRSNMDDVDQDKWQVYELYVEIVGLVMTIDKGEEASERVVSLKLDGFVLVKAKYLINHWQLFEANCGDVRVRPSMNVTLHDQLRCNVKFQ